MRDNQQMDGQSVGREGRLTALLSLGIIHLVRLGALGRLGLAYVLLATEAARDALALLGLWVISLVLVRAGRFLRGASAHLSEEGGGKGNRRRCQRRSRTRPCTCTCWSCRTTRRCHRTWGCTARSCSGSHRSTCTCCWTSTSWRGIAALRW